MPRLQVLSDGEAKAMLAQGYRFTPMSLYEPDHAPKGTVFVLIQNRPYRVREPSSGKSFI